MNPVYFTNIDQIISVLREREPDIESIIRRLYITQGLGYKLQKEMSDAEWATKIEQMMKTLTR